jgi:plastocyanin
MRVVSGFAAVFAAFLLLPLSAGWAQGTITGRVTLLEKAGQKTADLDNVVVWLESATPGSARPRPAKAELAMRTRQFAPHVRVVVAGSSVAFPNQDAALHNVFSSTPGSAFDLGLYARGQSKDHVFSKPGAIPVYCNVHSRMAGFVVVVATPWYAQAAADGRWEIENVPAGKYTLHIWHERGTAQKMPIVVTAGDTDAGALQLDARGFVLAEHKDKYGKDYSGPGQIKY